MILGLSGYARSGKDEAAKGLQLFGYERRAFADKLREFLYNLNPIVKPRYERAFAALVADQRLQDIIDRFTWDGYKATPYGKEIRELLQRLGTECGRELISDSIWVDLVFKNTPKLLVIPDVRFVNEAQKIKDEGGYIVRITRDGVTAANAHKSETALDDWDFDFVLDNNGTIEELHTRIANTALSFAL